MNSCAQNRLLAQVASTEDNPSGLSLALADSDNPLAVYVLGAGIVVGVGLVALMALIHHRTKIYHPHAPKPESHDGIPG